MAHEWCGFISHQRLVLVRDYGKMSHCSYLSCPCSLWKKSWLCLEQGQTHLKVSWQYDIIMTVVFIGQELFSLMALIVSLTFAIETNQSFWKSDYLQWYPNCFQKYTLLPSNRKSRSLINYIGCCSVNIKVLLVLWYYVTVRSLLYQNSTTHNQIFFTKDFVQQPP